MSPLKVRPSKVIITKKDSDFCTYYEGDNPLFYEIDVCPTCGFAFTDNFKPLRPQHMERVYKEYAQHVNGHATALFSGRRSANEALKCFKLALVCATLTDQPTMTIANMCMRIAWLNRYRQDQEEENKYLAKAVELYVEAYVSADLTTSSMNKNKLLYIIAEVYGRLEDYEQAKKWFNILLTQKSIEPAIKNLARKQWDYYKECM